MLILVQIGDLGVMGVYFGENAEELKQDISRDSERILDEASGYLEGDDFLDEAEYIAKSTKAFHMSIDDWVNGVLSEKLPYQPRKGTYFLKLYYPEWEPLLLINTDELEEE